MIFYIFPNPVSRYAMLAEFFELYRYAMLTELFDSMEVAIRLLRLHKIIISFRKICPQIKTMTDKYVSV